MFDYRIRDLMRAWDVRENQVISWINAGRLRETTRGSKKFAFVDVLRFLRVFGRNSLPRRWKLIRWVYLYTRDRALSQRLSYDLGSPLWILEQVEATVQPRDITRFQEEEPGNIPVSAILVDFAMGDEADGLRFVKELRTNEPEAPIVGILPEGVDRLRMKRGLDSVVPRTIDGWDLKELLGELAARKK